MNTQKFQRNSFPVEGVRVTKENMAEVSQWCKGTIFHRPGANAGQPAEPYIQVKVENPLTERQTMAFVGDWVLYAGKGYKVYKNQAFIRSFSPLSQSENVFEKSDSSHALSQKAGANPGGGTKLG